MKSCDQCSTPIEDGEGFKDGPLTICYYCHVREFGVDKPKRGKKRDRGYDEEDY